MQEVVDTVQAVTGQQIPVKIGPRRPGDPAELIAGSERIRKELGWQPRYPDLHSIVASAWRWHQAHPHGYGESQNQIESVSDKMK